MNDQFIEIYPAIMARYGCKKRKAQYVIKHYRRLLEPVRGHKLMVRPCKLALLDQALGRAK
jgi:hypothetical protein